MHDDYTLLMSLSLDGEATAAEESLLREHLRTCPACVAIWEQWQITDRRLTAAPMLAAPVDLLAKVMAQVDERELRHRRARWLGSGLLVAWLAAALLILAMIVVLVVAGMRNPNVGHALLSSVLRLLDVVSWLALGLASYLGGLGAPTIAAGVGLLATLTCVLGMLWLWVMGRGQAWSTQPVAAAD